MTEVLKGESELPSALADSHTPSSISQLSEKHDSSSEEVEKERERTITGFKVRWIGLVFLLNTAKPLNYSGFWL